MRRHLPLLTAACAAAAVVALVPRPARACATCRCGDPTLTTMGADKPFDGRLRVSLELEGRSDDIGEPRVDRVELRQQQAVLGAAYAPRDWLMLSARVPLVRLEAIHVNRAREVAAGLGDVELGGRAFVWQDREFAPRHLVAVQAALELPTGADREARPGETTLRLESRPGSGSFDPGAGVSYGYFAAPWSAYVSAIATVPGTGYDDTRAGASLRGTLAGQWQPRSDLALRLALDARTAAATREAGVTEPDSGGHIVYASPSLVHSPWTDTLVHATIRLPVANALRGYHDEGPIVAVGVTHDL